MNWKTIFFSLAYTTAVLFIPSVSSLAATPLRVPTPAPATGHQPLAVPVEPTADIRDIYGPIPLPPPPPYLYYGIGIILIILVIIGGWLLWTFMHRKKKHQPVDPAEQALSSLTRAENDLSQNGTHRFADEVSHILRSYIEAQFHITITRSTTAEFFSSLETIQDAGLDRLATQRDTLKQCLVLCDKIKFSRFLPPGDTMQSLADNVRSFINSTRLEPTEEIKNDALCSS